MSSEPFDSLQSFVRDKKLATLAMIFVTCITIIGATFAFEVYRSKSAMFEVMALAHDKINAWREIEKLTSFNPINKKDGSLNERLAKRLQDRVADQLILANRIEKEITAILEINHFFNQFVIDDKENISPQISPEILKRVNDFANLPVEFAYLNTSIWDSEMQIQFLSSKYLQPLENFADYTRQVGKRLSTITGFSMSLVGVIFVVLTYYLYSWVILPMFNQMIKQHKELINSKENEIHNERLRVLGQLSSGVAHEFNNVLGIISGNSELAIMKASNNEEVKKYLQRIMASSLKASHLTNQLLIYSRRQRMNTSVFPVAEFVKGLKSNLRIVTEDRIPFSIEVKSNAYIKVDPAYLEMSILNLVKNSFNACSQQADAEIKILVCDDKDKMVRISVIDNGPGIPQHFLDRVKEPFFSTDKTGKGTGLGLAMVEGFVTEFYGELDIKSRSGYTEISLLLPTSLPERTKYKPALPSMADSNTELKDVEILVVEDRLDEFVFLIDYLKMAGCKIEAVDSADLAINKKDQKWDLVICDVDLAGQSGLDVYNSFKNTGFKPPFIFVTGNMPNKFVRDGIVATGETIVDKPFTTSQLTNAIKSSLSPGLN